MIHYDDHALKLIEREMCDIYQNVPTCYPQSAYLLEIRKRLLNEQALTRESQAELLPDIIAFNDALWKALIQMYNRTHELYCKISATEPNAKIEAVCFLPNQYPSLHPLQHEGRQDLWEALCDACWNPLYDTGITFPLVLPRDIDMSFNEFTGMNLTPPNWNEYLDQRLTGDLHLINAFHNLFDHTNFAITDFIFCREFDFEYRIELEEKTTDKTE